MLKPTLLGLALVASAGAAGAEDRLTPLLRFVPAEAVAAGDVSAVQFTDLAATRAAALNRLSMLDRFAWSAEDRELAALFRVNALAGMLQSYVQYFHEITNMADYVGFAWADIEVVLGYGTAPTNPTVIVGGAAVTDPAVVAAALGGRGFASEERGGHTIWWRYEDNAIDVQNRDPADPLRGHLGGSARAGVVDGAFIAAANWGGIDQIIAAVDGAVPSLAQSADFAALAAALDRPVGGDGQLLQAWLIDGAFDTVDVALVLGRDADPEDVAAFVQEQLAQVGTAGTPRYSAIALADRQEGATAVGVVALAYADRADAETAALSVPAAFASQRSMLRDIPFAEVLPYAVAADVVEAEGRFVARIAFSQPAEGPLEAPGDNSLVPFRRLIEMVNARDTGPLTTAE